MDTPRCNIALKEWALTCRALQEGRQIVLLRKGGILDEDGAFAIEHDTFWLHPTYLHQSRHLVKPEYSGLLEEVEAAQQKGVNRQFITLQLLARVERVFTLQPEDDALLQNVRHIWSNDYIDLRYSFRPEYPLLCLALRVFVPPQPFVLPMRPEYSGCRSWLELAEPLEYSGARPALSDAEFVQQMEELEAALSGLRSTPGQAIGR